jgi:putative ABC transport system permease protein
MIKNYFKIAWRNLGKDKMYSFINIGGLALGMAVAILIGLWMYDEISFNKNFKNYDRIAQVIQNVTNNGEVQTWTSVPYPLSEELRKNYGSDFKHIAMGADLGDHIITYNDKVLKQNGGFFEKEMPEMFSLKMLHGSNSMEDPSSVLISAAAAKAFFGDENALNKLLKIDENPVVKVTGVYDDLPRNSTLAGLDFISSWDFMYSNSPNLRSVPDPWRPNSFLLYVQLNDNADFKTVSAKIRDAKIKKVNAQLAKKKPELFLQPMNKLHLYSEFRNGVNTGGAIQYVRLFGVIGAFVLLLACINFMNLSTARSEKRSKEVGIRKTVGCLRSQLIIQFFSESILTVTLAFAFSLLLVQLSLSSFNSVANKAIAMPWTNSSFWLANAGFILFTALIAGSYPALYLSSFNPLKVLKGTFKAGRFAAVPRKVLVVVQFTVSVVLIIGTMTVYRQIQFAKNRPVGYTREGLVSVPLMNSEIHKHFDVIKEELVKTGTVSMMAEAGSPTTGVWSTTSGLNWPGKDPNLSTDFGNIDVSYDYGKTIGWQFTDGRDFSKAFATDSSALVINESAAEFMHMKKTVDETITWWGKPFRIIGVVHNMVMNSPYDEAKPTIFNLSSNGGNIAILKIDPRSSAKDALGKIEDVFKKINTAQPFEYKFVDDDYAQKFGDEERIGKLASFFAILAVAISCLGLFGLTSFVAEQRKKEIGIRKVLGASVLNVWNLLSKDFVTLVIVSFLVAVPVSYYFMHNWLQNYHYRAEMSWWIFIAAGIGSLAITVLVVSIQAIKAAVANPVRSLRTE